VISASFSNVGLLVYDYNKLTNTEELSEQNMKKHLANIVWGFVLGKKLMVLHTFFNKATGSLLFVLPLTLPCIEPAVSFAVVCALATIAAIQEGCRIVKEEAFQK
jgi:hypothetical protein